MQLLIWFYVAVVLLDAVLHLHLAQNYILLIENPNSCASIGFNSIQL